MRAKVVSVAIDPGALQHGTLTGTGQWQLSIKTKCTSARTHYRDVPKEKKKRGGKFAALSLQEESYAVLQLTGDN